MAEEEKYTETEFRKKVLEVADWYRQVERRYQHVNSSIYKSHELRIFIANARQAVPPELQDSDFKKCIEGLEKKLKQIQQS